MHDCNRVKWISNSCRDITPSDTNALRNVLVFLRDVEEYRALIEKDFGEWLARIGRVSEMYAKYRLVERYYDRFVPHFGTIAVEIDSVLASGFINPDACVTTRAFVTDLLDILCYGKPRGCICNGGSE